MNHPNCADVFHSCPDGQNLNSDMLLQFNCDQSPLYQHFTSPCAKPFVNNAQDRSPRAEKFILELKL